MAAIKLVGMNGTHLKAAPVPHSMLIDRLLTDTIWAAFKTIIPVRCDETTCSNYKRVEWMG